MSRVPPPAEAIARIWGSRDLPADFEALCDVGGRFAGSESEARARALLRERLDAIAAGLPGARVLELPFEYQGWARESTRLLRVAPGEARALAAHALVWSPPTPPGGLEAEVVDLGRGTPEDFAQAGTRLTGRFALVRHEYPFASGVIHRRVKYGLAREYGAAGFLIASNLPGQVLVTGSSGVGGADDIPAAGLTLEGGEALAPRAGVPARARLEVAVRRGPARAANLVLEVPGAGPEWVVLSAHYDGHDLAESALDNATGVAAVLEIVRALGPHVPRARRGLRAMLFTVEEWGLYGSRVYADGLDEEACRAIALNVNLDTIAGGGRLAALVSGFADLGDWVSAAARDAGLDLRVVVPLMPNSDHANFARRGIPALRLVAGFDDPQAGPRYLLTTADTRDKVHAADLKAGTLVAAEIVWRALAWEGQVAVHRERTGG
ncbi:MAG TPA: M28 family peptidase [Thermodesulfobacteriota bacterium]